MALGKKTGGRQKGTPNKVTAEIRDLAQQHGPEAISRLAKLMESDDDRVVISACEALLDRGYGRPRQSMEVLSEGPRRPMDMSERELLERIAAIDERRAATGNKSGADT